MRIRLRHERGFTFIKLLVVVALLGVTASIAIPSIISWVPTIRVNSAARRLVSDMQLARTQAVSERNRYVITFDVVNGQYTIHDDNDNDGNLDETGSLATSGDESAEGPTSLPNGIRFGYVAGETGTSGGAIPNVITFTGLNETFNPNGAATKNGSIYLIPAQDVTSGRKHRQRAITVIQTGRIKIWKYHKGGSTPWK